MNCIQHGLREVCINIFQIVLNMILLIIKRVYLSYFLQMWEIVGAIYTLRVEGHVIRKLDLNIRCLDDKSTFYWMVGSIEMHNSFKMSLPSFPIISNWKMILEFNGMNSRSWIYSINVIFVLHMWRLVGVKLITHKIYTRYICQSDERNWTIN